MDTVVATRTAPPPAWALRQRHLIAAIDDAIPVFQSRYTRADGTFVWRQEWPGMDGSDDGYEAYGNWPLHYLLGGRADLLDRSRFLWDAVTRQFTAYGQIWREFDAYYDWMHHGESSLFLYHLGLAGEDPLIRARTVRFADMATGNDPDAPNWDPKHRMMRSPINGSRGPRHVNTAEDWSTHREVLAHYPPPFDDIPGVDGPTADWNDDAVFSRILDFLNRRMMTGDVPLNLTATSLATQAYAMTGEERFRTWVLDYLGAWAERIAAAPDGLCPDNVDEHGVVGGRMDGKWWGGYYGWRWPHGLMTVLQPLCIAAMNAVLLTGDLSWCDIPRGQIERIAALGRTVDGALHVPHRRTDSGWTAYRPLAPEFALQLALFTQDRRDFERLATFPERVSGWTHVAPGRGKGDDIHIAPWFRYLEGDVPDYPERILEAQLAEVARRMELVANETSDPETWDVHHWQDRNPVHTEALLQLVCGGPQAIYHGGLQHLRLRPWDPEAGRPGLPPDIAVRVHALDENSVSLDIVHTGAVHARRIALTPGAYHEHAFTDVSVDGGPPRPIGAEGLNVELAPIGAVALRIGMRRFARRPTTTPPTLR